MKVVKIQFSDGAIFCQKIVKRLLSDEYIVQEVDSNPDLLIYSLYGPYHRNVNSKKLLMICENSFPNFNECDYAISPNYVQFENRHCRIPFFVFNKEYSLLCQNQIQKIKEPFQRPFCSALISNNVNPDPIREEILRKIHSRKQICSAGRVFNTVNGYLPKRQDFAENLDTKFTNPSKIEFISRFKFNLSLENTSVNGYCTEKITDAFEANTIPIYWGDKKIYNEFPRGSFININDFESLDKAIDFILDVDSNEELYMNMLNSFQMIHKDYLEILKNFLINCIEGETFEHKYGNFYYQNN